MDPAAIDAAAQTDGRSRRRALNREKCVAALVELVREGNLEPGAEEVARRAGVGLRTVFRLFDDIEGLYRSCADILRAEVLPLVNTPFASTTLAGRLDELISRRAAVFERVAAFRRFTETHRHKSPYLQAGCDNFVRQQREMLAAAFEGALTPGSTAFEALDMAMSFDAWRRLRMDQKLSRRCTQEVLRFLGLRILGLSENDATPLRAAADQPGQ